MNTVHTDRYTATPAARLSPSAVIMWWRVYAGVIARGQWSGFAADLIDVGAESAATHVERALRGDPLAAGASSMARRTLAAVGHRLPARSTRTGLDPDLVALLLD